MLFHGILDLARLPYFQVENGNLTLSPSVGPVIDMHAHLALAYLLPMQVDLHKETPKTYHYLPVEKPFHLEKYTSHNISKEDLSRCKRDLLTLTATPWGKRATHTIPNLLREMNQIRVEKTLLLAIDYPFLSKNSETYLEALAGRKEFIPFASIHPLAPNMEKKLDLFWKMGAKGIKIHPAVQIIRPDHPQARRLYKMCGERNLPIFFHCGPVGVEPYLGRAKSQVRFYRRPIEECPQTTFILGHSGALQVKEGLQLAKDYPNVYLELVCQSLENMKMIFREGPSDRIFYGSDWPFYHQAMTLSKVLLGTEGNPELRRKILYENAVAFLKKLGVEFE